jgi:hypothetical protein
MSLAQHWFPERSDSRLAVLMFALIPNKAFATEEVERLSQEEAVTGNGVLARDHLKRRDG